MEPRAVAALVSSLVSQALLLLLLFLPPTSSTPLLLVPSIPPPPPPAPPPLHLLVHLLSISHIATTSSLLPRKRKRLDSSIPLSIPHPYPFSFLVSSSTFHWLSALLDPLLPSRSRLCLPPPTALALALSRLASGLPYSDLSRRFSVAEPAARSSVRRLCRVLCTNFRFWVAFPSAPDLCQVSTSFESLPGALPDCCGAVTCARFGSLAVQIVADSSSRILSICAGLKSDRSDYQVLRCSSLCKDVETGRLLSSSQYLVGDGNYPLLPWVMVPYEDPIRGTCEEDFNAAHRLMCRPVLRTVASLKNWGVLGCLEEEEDMRRAVACIGTCAILHNVLLMREDYTALADESKDSSEVLGRLERNCGFQGFVADKRALVLRSVLSVRARMVAN